MRSPKCTLGLAQGARGLLPLQMQSWGPGALRGGLHPPRAGTLSVPLLHSRRAQTLASRWPCRLEAWGGWGGNGPCPELLPRKLRGLESWQPRVGLGAASLALSWRSTSTSQRRGQQPHPRPYLLSWDSGKWGAWSCYLPASPSPCPMSGRPLWGEVPSPQEALWAGNPSHPSSCSEPHPYPPPNTSCLWWQMGGSLHRGQNPGPPLCWVTPPPPPLRELRLVRPWTRTREAAK